MHNFAFIVKFVLFVDCVILMQEKIPGSPQFPVLQVTKSWAGHLGMGLMTDVFLRRDFVIRNQWPSNHITKRYVGGCILNCFM